MYQMEVLGLPPQHMLDSAKRTSLFFTPEGEPRQTTDRKGASHLPGTKPLNKALGTDDPTFLDFLRGVLEQGRVVVVVVGLRTGQHGNEQRE